MIQFTLFKNVRHEVDTLIQDCSMKGRSVQIGRLLSMCEDDDDLIYALKQADENGVLADPIRQQYKDYLH